MMTREKLEEMFAHYIERKRYNQSVPSDSQDGLWSAGVCAEAKKWLEYFGVDLSYERIQPMIDGKVPVRMVMRLEPDLDPCTALVIEDGVVTGAYTNYPVGTIEVYDLDSDYATAEEREKVYKELEHDPGMAKLDFRLIVSGRDAE